MERDINALRVLAIDMVEKAKSGHPGICMGAAPMMYELYAKKINVYANESSWINRDRFVLSAGHGSAMLYSTLHFSGYDLNMRDLKEFRQLNSKTPGHPEYKHTDGVDATTGPLGQGFSQAVGMSLADAHLGQRFNKGNLKLIDHYTYVLCGDGDLQEGVVAESAAFAGHLKLNKLIVLWDSNGIQLDDKVSASTSEDTLKRFDAYNWNTAVVKDGNDVESISLAIETAKKSDKPTIIEVKTIIGYGAPNKQNSSSVHGSPLGEDLKLAKKFYNWEYPPFEIPEEVYENFQKNTIEKGYERYHNWEIICNQYKEKYPDEYKIFLQIKNRKIEKIEHMHLKSNLNEGTRISSQFVINNINEQIPHLIGGSADLSKSNNTVINGSSFMTKSDYSGKNIAFGVREFGMACITNGIVLHSGLKAFCSTFFVFSDYLKAAIRLSAIQKIPTIYVLTHDSIAVGEDGATHAPVEQLTGLRAIPNINVIRPSDANEVQLAWDIALESKETPTIIVLTRQNVPLITNLDDIKEDFSKGAYVISEEKDPCATIIASGSEVSLALKVQEQVKKEGQNIRVVSMPSTNIFDRQSETYKNQILKNKREDIYYLEMSTAEHGYKYGDNVLNIEKFGKSGKGDSVVDDFGFTIDCIIERLK